MNKKVIGIISILVIICIIAFVAVFALNNKNSSKNDNNSNVDKLPNEDSNKEDNTSDGENKNNTEENKSDEEDKKDETQKAGKTLVVYYSASNNTKSVAEQIAKNLNADIFEIVPADAYTLEDLNYNNPDSRVSKEHNDESLRNVKLKTSKVDNWNSYDTILIGYPIWWGIAAWPVETFVTANKFEGKTVIPFCTSASSGLGESGKLLAKEAQGGNWLEGYRFNSDVSDTEIKEWTDSLK